MRFYVAIQSSAIRERAQVRCATLWRMDELKSLDQATSHYRQTKTKHAKAREETIKAVVAALQAGQRPTVVQRRSPFTAAYVRKIAREHGIESPGANT